MITRNRTKIPKPGTNPAAGLISDTLTHHGITNASAARAMRIPSSRLCDIIKGRKGVSVDTALRFERCFGISAQWLTQLQADFDYLKAYHAKADTIAREIEPLSLSLK